MTTYRPYRSRRNEIDGVGCTQCGAAHLKLYRSSSNRDWYLVDSRYERHECVESQLAQQSLVLLKQIFVNAVHAESLAAAQEAEEQVKAIKESVLGDTRTLVQNVAAELGTVQERLSTDLEQRVQNNLLPSIRAFAERAIREAVPVEHRLVIEHNGTTRQIEGRPHYLMSDLLEIASLRMHSMLVGPAGSGKSTAARQVAEALSLPYYERSMGPATSQWDLLGYLSPDGKYIPGIVRAPYEHGGVLMLDEMDNSNPSVLTALNAALANGHASFPDREVARHNDFILIAAGNTYGKGADRIYVGRQQLDGATLDRFAVLDWDYDEEAELQWAGTDQIAWTRYVQAVRSAVAQTKMRMIVSPRASISGAKMLRAGITPEKVAERVLWKGISAEDKDRLLSIAGVYDYAHN